MRKVLLADDEPYILTDIQALIDWEEMGYQIAAVARDGGEAEVLAKLHSPDIIISDIRMPGLNGLQLAERMLARNPKKLVILLSAYNDFEYAQKALQLGAFDYLLKPVEAGALQNVLSRATERLNEMELQERKLAQLSLSQWLLSILEDYDQKVENPLSAQNLIKNKEASLGIVMRSRRDQPAIDEMVAEFYHFFPAAVMIPVGLHKGFGILPSSQLGPASQFLRAAHWCRRWDVCLGVSRPFHGIKGLQAALMQADGLAYCDFITGRGGIYREHQKSSSLKALIRQAATVQTKTALLACLDTAVSTLKRSYVSPDQLASFINAYLQSCMKFHSGDWNYEPFTGKELVQSFPGLQECYECLQAELDIDQTPSRSNSGYLIEDILRDMEQNYGNRLLLSEYAQRYHLNTSYLSSLFKREVGRSFTAYLVEMRLNKAQELLRDGSLNLISICNQVGYDDYYCFSKLFKKYTGLSPNAYRKQQRRS